MTIPWEYHEVPMTSLKKPVGWLLLCVFLTGCGSYQSGTFADQDPDVGPPEPGRRIEVGDYVVVDLVSGERVEGKVTRLDSSELELGHRGNYGHEDLVVIRADIETVSIREASDGAIEGAWFGFILIAMVTATVYGLSQLGTS